MQNPKNRPWLAVAVTAAAVFIANLDAAIITVALPQLAQAFGASVSGIAWLSLAYLLACASLLLVLGKVGDAIGPERLLGRAYIVFGLASLLCSAASGMGWLLVFRVLQGGAAAALLASALAVAARNVPAGALGRAFGVISVFGAMGFAAGPAAGGFIVQHFGWRWIFALNVPVAAAGFYAVALLGAPATAPRRLELDAQGALLSCCALGLLVYALGGGPGQGAPLKIASWSGAALFAFLFVRREASCADPLVPGSLFSAHGAAAALVACAAAVAAVDGTTFTLPFFLDTAASLTPSKTGLLMSLLPLASLFCGPVAGWMSDRFGAVRVCAAAAVLMAMGGFVFAFSGTAFSLPLTVAGLLFFGLGLGFFFPANVSFIMAHAPSGREGTVSAVVNAAQSTAGAAGVAAFSSIYAGVSVGYCADAARGALASFSACGLAAAACAAAALAFTLLSARPRTDAA